METAELYSLFLENGKISTDTRTISKGDLFFALKGANYNGNQFASGAIKNGASYAVIDQAEFCLNQQYILVTDVLKTLQELATLHRKSLNIPVIAITGSNGKTTTKELYHKVLSTKFETFATVGNLNNHIGVPLTLLSMTGKTQIAIVEMGANHQGEIADLCAIALPEYGTITNIGKAHLEGFGGIEGVKKGKGEMFRHLILQNGTLILNGTDPTLLDLAGDYPKSIKFGYTSYFTCFGIAKDRNGFLSVLWKEKAKPESEHICNTMMTGQYNLDNVLSAISIGLHFGIQPMDINQAIESYFPSNSRSQIIYSDKNTIIADAYNANPSSMTVALENVSAMSHQRKVVILGDMYELGDSSEKEHEAILRAIDPKKVANTILIGSSFKSVADKSKHNSFFEVDEAVEWLIKHPIQDALILVKGSRGVKLEKIIELLTRQK
jgi:UDP-N-acetylmuramoyl-tripeptide--D-alanyl-D-alanine ligase